MTPHFSKAEVACKCGCGLLPPQSLMDRAERVRVKVGFPMPVNSGARCPEYNAKVSGTGLTGPHTKGALDIGVSGKQALAVIAAAQEEGMTGIGVKQHGPYAKRFVHLDDLPNADGQPRPHLWSYP